MIDLFTVSAFVHCQKSEHNPPKEQPIPPGLSSKQEPPSPLRGIHLLRGETLALPETLGPTQNCPARRRVPAASTPLRLPTPTWRRAPSPNDTDNDQRGGGHPLPPSPNDTDTTINKLLEVEPMIIYHMKTNQYEKFHHHAPLCRTLSPQSTMSTI